MQKINWLQVKLDEIKRENLEKTEKYTPNTSVGFGFKKERELENYSLERGYNYWEEALTLSERYE